MAGNLSFILAMVLHPEAQRRAQEEIDGVVGKGNLPAFEDLDKLPYMTAIFYEVLRWDFHLLLRIFTLPELVDLHSIFQAGTHQHPNVIHYASLR